MNKENEGINNSVKETEEIVSNVEKIEELNSEELIQEEIVEEIEKVEVNEKRKGFASRLMASLLDQVLCSGLTIIILFIVISIINVFGYRFVLLGNYKMFIIFYIIVNVLYCPIMEGTRMKKTFGKMFLKI